MVKYSKRKTSYLHPGTEVVTDDFRIGIVDSHHNNDCIVLRHHNPLWPFAEIGIKTRSQLKEIPVEYPEAML